MPSSPPQDPCRESAPLWLEGAGRVSHVGRAGRIPLPLAKLGLQDAHRDLVPPAPVTPDRLTRPALGYEPARHVGPNRPLVELEDGQPDPVDAERPEGMIHHQSGRFRAVPMAPGVPLADRDVEQRRPVVAVELAERAGSYEPIRIPNVDRHGQGLGADGPRLEEAIDLLEAHRAVLVAGEPGDLRIRIPASERADVLGDVASEHDEPALDGRWEPRSTGHVGTVYHRRHASLERARGAG